MPGNLNPMVSGVTRAIAPTFTPMSAVILAIGGQVLLSAEQWIGAACLTVFAGVIFYIHMRRSGSVSSRYPIVGLLPPDASTQTEQFSKTTPFFAHRAAWRGWAVGMLVGGSLILAGAAWVLFDFSTPSHVPWWLHAGSLLVMACAAGVDSLLSRSATPSAQPDVARGQRRLCCQVASAWGRIVWGAGLLGVISIAAALRFYSLAELPFGTWYDEAANGLEALRIVNEANFRPVYNDGVNSSGHYLFLIGWFFQGFGVETESIRLISAVMGVGMVAAAYGLGYLLLGHTGGLVFALLLAVSRWAVNFSRIGMYNISTPLFAVAALYFLLRGVRSGRPADFILAGICAGLGATFYSAYFLVLPMLVLAVLAALWWRAPGAGNQSAGRPPRSRQPLAIGLVCAVLAAGVVWSPTAKFALERPDNYFGRVRTTSLWARTAPEARFGALWRNTQQHVQMFHVRGDPNGRHNIPGHPMLDPISGGLMLLGLVYCLARPRDPLSLLLPFWLGSALLGGILSLDFESPQSLRSIGALPPAYLLASLPLWVIWRRATNCAPKQFSRTWLRAGAALSIGVTLTVIAAHETRAYFQVQANDFASWNAFSTPETLAARLLAEHPGLAEGTVEAHVISLFEGHPTLRFLAPNAAGYNRLETTDTLPLLVPPDRGLLLIVDADRRFFYAEAQSLYPEARFQNLSPPFGGPTVLHVIELSPEVQKSIQGATRETVPETEQGQLVEVQQSTVLAEVGTDLIAWQATLMIPSYGTHWFHVAVNDPVRSAEDYALYIGNQRVDGLLEPTNLQDADGGVGEEVNGSLPQGPTPQDQARGVTLAQGPHLLRLLSRATDGDAAMERPDWSGHGYTLYWRTPEHDWREVPDWLLYREPVRPQGLTGRYFANGEWTEPEAFARIDQRWEMYFHVPSLPRPYTVEWRGHLQIPASGEYGLGVQSRDESVLWLNEAEIVTSLGDGEQAFEYLWLEAGLHEIRIRYADRTHHTNFRLLWQPPGDTRRQTLPAAYLFPSGIASNVVAPVVFLPTTGAGMGGEPGVPTQRRLRGVASVEVVADGLAQPIGIARHADGTLWITEPGVGRVSGFAADGSPLGVIEQGADVHRFREPYGVAFSAQGELLVADTEAGQLHRFRLSQDTQEPVIPMERLAIEPELLQLSRGLSMNEQGEIWVAATTRGELLRFSPEGNLQRAMPLRVGGDVWEAAQPVSVASDAEGNLWVVDPGLQKLVIYARDGRRLFAWDIPVANTFSAPHMIAGPGGLMLRTSPEEGELVGYHPSGQVAIVWSLRSAEMPTVRPVGMAMDASGIIWVVDTDGGRLLRVELELPDLRATLPDAESTQSADE